MVVCIFVNIEFAKVIIGLVVLEVGGNKSSAVDGDKVNSTVDCINVNYRDVGALLAWWAGWTTHIPVSLSGLLAVP
ncbi:hypothetical protein BDR04DRAFT_1194151, partial [Suillus decipiens]